MRVMSRRTGLVASGGKSTLLRISCIRSILKT